MWNPRLAHAIGWALVVFGCGAAQGQNVRQDFWFANATVRTVALSGNTLYIGGDFTQVGPVTGCGVPIDARSGVPVAGFPVIVGQVQAVASDGAGGWFVGGDFKAVGDVPRAHLAHILADLTVAAWDPGADNPVDALVLSGNTLYVGGLFGRVGGLLRPGLAAIDAASGAVRPWAAATDGAVFALAANESTVYAGGWFRTVAGQPRSGIAAIIPHFRGAMRSTIVHP